MPNLGKEQVDTGRRLHQPAPGHAGDDAGDGKGEDEQGAKERFALDFLIQE